MKSHIHEVVTCRRLTLAGITKSLFLAFCSVLVVSGCAGYQTFALNAYPGETVGFALHRQADVSKLDATIIVTDSLGTDYSIPATDPSVRAWYNIYADPVSRALVGRETFQNLGASGSSLGAAIENQINLEKDIFETIVLMDLPTGLEPGIATIDVQVGGSTILKWPIEVNVLAGTGTPHPFEIFENDGPVTTEQFKTLTRARHYIVSLSGSTIPAAVQIDLTHDPDNDNGGAGQVYVVHPRGDIKSVMWTDDGIGSTRVIMMPSWNKTTEDINRTFQNIERMEWWKFYVAGRINNLAVASVDAYDVDGNPVTGVTASLQYIHN